MSGYVVWVDFRLHPGARARFRPLVDANAVASVREEPGCRRFDVLEDPADPDRIVLYEIYDSGEAFDEHCRTPHFHAFDAESAPLVREKLVARYDLVLEGHLDGRD